MGYTKDQLIEIIKQKEKELGRTPTSSSFDRIPLNAFLKVFGTWNNALVEAGLCLNRERDKYSKEELINIIQYTAKKLSKIPTIDDIKYPSRSVFQNTFWKLEQCSC